nr:nuclease-related domain-containing protein [Neobacillus sp. Marseille-Q6967]
MFDKEFQIPKKLLQSEALRGRLVKNHHKLPEVDEKIKILRSGYNGEKAINYYLSQIPKEKYHIFHNLRLPAGNSFFQIDFLLLSSQIFMLEGKNHSGTIQIDPLQMVQEGIDKREVYENPVSQANRHKLLLFYLLNGNQVPYLPIDNFVVFTRNSTEINISPDYKEAQNKVIKVSGLISKLEKAFKGDRIDPQTIAKIRRLLLKKHTPSETNILEMFQISNNEVLTGVHCPNCLFLPMIYNRGKWQCPSCQCLSKTAHIQGIFDYFLIHKPTFTNSEIRGFLHLPSSRITTEVLSSLDLQWTGNTSDRIYHQPKYFPLTANHVFHLQTNTNKNKNRGNMDEKIIVHP